MIVRVAVVEPIDDSSLYVSHDIKKVGGGVGEIKSEIKVSKRWRKCII